MRLKVNLLLEIVKERYNRKSTRQRRQDEFLRRNGLSSCCVIALQHAVINKEAQVV